MTEEINKERSDNVSCVRVNRDLRDEIARLQNELTKAARALGSMIQAQHKLEAKKLKLRKVLQEIWDLEGYQPLDIAQAMAHDAITNDDAVLPLSEEQAEQSGGRLAEDAMTTDDFGEIK